MIRFARRPRSQAEIPFRPLMIADVGCQVIRKVPWMDQSAGIARLLASRLLDVSTLSETFAIHDLQ
jgi:hypothetical protein